MDIYDSDNSAFVLDWLIEGVGRCLYRHNLCIFPGGLNNSVLDSIGDLSPWFEAFGLLVRGSVLNFILIAEMRLRGRKISELFDWGMSFLENGMADNGCIVVLNLGSRAA